jgi:hypothetical protein
MDTGRAFAEHKEVPGGEMRYIVKNRMTVLSICVFLTALVGGAGAQINISNSPSSFSTCPRLAVDSSGNVHAIWAEFYSMNGGYPTSGDAFYAKYNIATKQWSAPLNLSNSGQCFSGEWYCVGIDADASGNVYAIYIDGPSLKLRILSNGSWSSPFNVATAGGGSLESARIAVTAGGDIFAVCCYYPGVYSRARIGGVWESVASLTYPGTVSKFPEISVGTNQVYCVFMDNHYTPSYYTAVYVQRAVTYGAAWSSSQRMTNAATWEEHPAVRVDANDVAHVIYTPYYESNASRDVRYVEGTSSGFSAPLVLGTTGNVHYPSLAVRGTNVYACWQSSGVHYRNRVAGAWAAESAVPNAYCNSLTDVAASPCQDKLYYVWDTWAGDIYFSELAGPGSVPAPSFDTYNSKLYAAIQSDADHGIYYSSMDASLYWYPWVRVPNGATSDKPALAGFNSRLYLTVKGNGNNSIWYNSTDQTDTWAGWTQLSGATPSAPSLAEYLNRLILVVRGENSQIYCRSMDASQYWQSWVRVPNGGTNDKPAVAGFNSRLYLMVKGNGNNSIWYNSADQTDTWAGWTRLSGATPSAPSLAEYLNRLFLVVRGENNQIYCRSMDTSGTWTSWSVVPGQTTSGAPEVAVFNGVLYIVIKGPTGEVLYWNSTIDGVNWSGWSILYGG